MAGLKAILVFLVVSFGLTGTAFSQNLFQPVARVNDRVITQFELLQRARFLELLGATPNPEKEALDRLIDERVQMEVMTRYGVVVTDEQIEAGMTEFASRAQLTAEDFIKALQSSGVEAETFRDFVMVGLGWRELVRGRFGGSVRISDVDIDRALSATAPRREGVRVLFSEIILPADTPQNKAQALALAAEVKRNPGSFASVAREYSLAGTRERGGRSDWLELSDMQPGLAAILLALQPGEVSDAIPIQKAVAIFQLAAVTESDAIEPKETVVDYVILHLPGGHSPEGLALAAKVASQNDTCEDLYAGAMGQDPSVLERASGAPGSLPADIAFELAKLDAGEVSTGLTDGTGGTLRLLMLCSRNRVLAEPIERDKVREGLISQQLAAFAEGWLAELRGNAKIEILNQ